MRRLAAWPFAWGFGVAAGFVLALVLGPYGPTWGTAAAFPAAAAVLSFGAWREDDGEELAHLLRATLGFTLGFLATTVPITLGRLAEMIELAPAASAKAVAAEVGRMRFQVLARWLVMALALPGGAAILALRPARRRR
ncbi:MAG TPA: hypothetical protein VIL20_18700, partial [Sandaracinaceae bacterium]